MTLCRQLCSRQWEIKGCVRPTQHLRTKQPYQPRDSVKSTYFDISWVSSKTPYPVCDFTLGGGDSGVGVCVCMWRGGSAVLGFTPFWCAVTGDKGDCAPLDRSLVTLMAQGSLIETIGVKRTLEITNIRSQLSCWCADRQTKKERMVKKILKKERKKEVKNEKRKGRNGEAKSLHILSSEF